MKTEWPIQATPQQRAATHELLRRLSAKYAERLLTATLFGSVARGDFTPDSDIDVLVVMDEAPPEMEWDLWGLGAETSLEFDVIFNLHIYSRAQWERLRAQSKTLWRNIERDGVELTLKPALV
jgi:predicted nucleotidyltransferase